jgi:hypothetical protein
VPNGGKMANLYVLAMDSNDVLIAGAEYVTMNEMRLVQGTEFQTVDLPLDYEVGFTLTPDADMVDGWSNIIHISATGGNCCNYGDRVPAVWFYANTRRMHVRDGSAGNGNNGCDPEEQLPAGERSTVQIQLQPGALAVLINGEAKCEGDRNDGRTIHENARVFASDPWHAATLATINNFYVASMIPASGCTDGAACNYDRNPAVDDD